MSDTLNTIEVLFGLRELPAFESQLSRVEKASLDIIKGIQDGFESAKSLPEKAVELIDKSTSGINQSLSIQYNKALSNLEIWYADLAKVMGISQPAIFTQLQNSFLSPLNKAISEMKDKASIAVDFVKEKFNIAYGFVSDFAEKTYAATIGKAYQLSKEIYDTTINHVLTNYPKVAKAIEGTWLMAKVASLGVAKTVVEIPQMIGKGIDFLKSYGSAILNTFQNAGISMLAVGKIALDLGVTLYQKSKDITLFLGKISGITYALMGAQKFVTFALQVTGVGAALAMIKKFVWGSGDEFGSMFEAFSVVSETIETVFEPMSNILLQLAGRLSEVVARVLTPFFLAISEILLKSLDYVNKLMTESKGFSEGLNFMSQVVSGIGEILVGMFSFIMETIIPILTPLFSEMIGIVQEMAKTLVPIFREIGTVLAPVFKNLVNSLLPAIRTLLQTIFSVWKTVFSTLATALPPLLKTIGEALVDVMPVLEKAFRAIGQLAIALAPALSAIVKILANVFSKVLPPVIWALSKILELAAFVVEWFSEILGDVFREYGETVVGVFDDIFVNIGKFFTWLPTAVSDAFNAVLDFFSSFGSSVMSVLGFDSAIDNVGSVFSSMLSLIQSPLEIMKSLINTSLVEPLRYALTGQIPIIGESLASLFGLELPTPFAEGGVVRTPTRAIVGEAGPEMILPLKPEIIQEILPTMFPTQSKIVVDDNTEINRTIISLLREEVALLKDLLRQKASQDVPIRTGPDIKFALTGFIGGGS
jgi:phage-related protein